MHYKIKMLLYYTDTFATNNRILYSHNTIETVVLLYVLSFSQISATQVHFAPFSWTKWPSKTTLMFWRLKFFGKSIPSKIRFLRGISIIIPEWWHTICPCGHVFFSKITLSNIPLVFINSPSSTSSWRFLYTVPNNLFLTSEISLQRSNVIGHKAIQSPFCNDVC